MSAIGRAIAARREARGLLQKELAEQVGISPGHMSALESGSKNATIITLLAIADVLECTVEDLMHDAQV